MCRTLAQLRTNKSPLLVSYLFSIGDPRHPSPLCPLCLMHDHTSSHLFECKSLPTSLSSLDLWTNPDKVEPSLPPGGRDCWLPHDSGAGLCWQHVGGVGSTTTTTTNCVRWYGRVLRRDDGHVLRRPLDFRVEDQRKKGMLKRTW